VAVAPDGVTLIHALWGAVPLEPSPHPPPETACATHSCSPDVVAVAVIAKSTQSPGASFPPPVVLTTQT
jgi:hypothetical protein